MATNTIDAALLQKMFLAGAKNLEAKKEWINELECIPGAGWRYGNQYDTDNYVCGKRSAVRLQYRIWKRWQKQLRPVH